MMTSLPPLSLEVAKLAARFTRADCDKMEEAGLHRFRYELMEGMIVRSPPRLLREAMTVSKVVFALRAHWGHDHLLTLCGMMVAPDELAKFGPNSPLTLSLPKYTPDPGSTPDPVNLSAIWDTTINQARLNWTPSNNLRLDRYEIRQSGAATYRAKDESNAASVVRTATELVTTVGLVVPGAVNCFKLYVVTEDGNEAGSNAVKVVRGQPV